ncbi:unnamed protein product [Psylliodes chrysocephalus]|uniref:Uncharacterized protein n=1 Tax=Psylliodes chrysocephalus TaxID=3402493 RepID=A0A9P0GEM0_9CUCU|nr:unnamed protein product [Psylliodes chrysocephala]
MKKLQREELLALRPLQGTTIGKDIFAEVQRLWGLHRFEKNPWSTKVRPFRRLKHFENLQLGALEKKGKLTKRMIGCCLSYLERSPYDMKYALCKCQLAEKGIRDISALRSYHYIQYLDLSHNRITTLEPLSEMPFLQYLNVSHNYIENPFDFKAPLYLTTVNYSNNRIVKIPNLSALWSITSLDLSFNCIREIKGLDSLKMYYQRRVMKTFRTTHMKNLRTNICRQPHLKAPTRNMKDANPKSRNLLTKHL